MADIIIDLKGDGHIKRMTSGGLTRGVVTRIITKTAVIGENQGKLFSPVDTGRLRASITHKVSGNVGQFGTNVFYGIYLDQPKTRRPRYRGGPHRGRSTSGWLTKRARDKTQKEMEAIVDDERKGMERRWRT